MDANINVSPESLRNFSDYVRGFSRTIQSDCQELGAALRQLQTSMDDEEIQNIRSQVQSIRQILEDGEPALQDLAQKVDTYAAFVARLQAAARS